VVICLRGFQVRRYAKEFGAERCYTRLTVLVPSTERLNLVLSAAAISDFAWDAARSADDRAAIAAVHPVCQPEALARCRSIVASVALSAEPPLTLSRKSVRKWVPEFHVVFDAHRESVDLVGWLGLNGLRKMCSPRMLVEYAD